MAESPPIERPWLRIETGTHTANMRDADTDAEGRVLVTASEDKTARVWSLPDLRPLGVLRPPIGEGDEGKLYAVAVAPDGQTVAVGGFTGRDDSSRIGVYVFDLSSRAIVRRIGGLPNVAQSLAFARDGRLAAGLGGANGIRVWRETTEIFADRDYGAPVYGVTFASDGRLATTSEDGRLRLYDAAGTLRHTQAAAAGKRPFRLRFSPDGSLLAVGFRDAVAVEVRDGATLALRSRPDVSGLNGTWLSRVAWSADGQTLFAGGDQWDGAGCAVQAWTSGGRGKRRIAAKAFSEAITTVLPQSDTGLVAGSWAGNLATVGADGARQHQVLPAGSDLRTMTDPKGKSWRLRLSSNGGNAEWVTFAASDRLLSFDATAPAFSIGVEAPGLVDWSAEADGLRATDWNGRTDPKLNGKALTLDAYERSQSVAAAHNRLLLGADFWLRLFDANANLIWRVPVPDVPWRVNQSPDGRLAVAALGDSTIRWYRADNGQELLALMTTEDAQRWVAFTPSGYYAAGPGSENLIGWHVNRGADQAADFFPASRFRDRFDRPDIVRRILQTLDEAEAVGQADAARGADTTRAPPTPAALATELLQDRPPVVTILAPRAGAPIPDDAELLVEIRSPTGRPITLVEARLNGRPPADATVEPPTAVAAPAGELAEHRWIRLRLPPDEDCTIQVIARCEDRISEAATLFRPRLVAQSLRKPRLHAVLVGVSKYREESLRLQFAAKDAADFAIALQRQKGGLYEDVTITVVPEAEATRQTILRRLVELQRGTGQRDVAILFLAGHGVAEDIEYYFLTVDADPDMPSVDGLSGTDLRRHLRQIAGRTLVFLDTCYAGAIVEGRATRDLPLDIGKFLNELASPETGVIVYCATSSRQRAEEHAVLRNGVFTAALLETLDGRAGHPQQEPIRLLALGGLLSQRVQSLSGGKQTPTCNPLDPLADLPLFLVR